MNTALNLDEIIAGCRNNNIHCQEALYKCCYQDMMKICLRYVNNREEAAALFNKSMLKIFSSISRYDAKGKFLEWARTIVINTCIDNVRIKPPVMHPLQFNDSDAVFIEAESFSNISAKEILAMIRELPQNLRVVFTLFAVEGYQHYEISTLLKIPEGTSKWYASEARKLLKQKLEQYSAPLKSLANEK